MEFLVGVYIISAWLLRDKKAPGSEIERLLSHSVAFVVIPSTYVLNRETTKQIIVLENWFMAIRSVFMSREVVAPLLER